MPFRANPVQKKPISKFLLKLATPVETPAKSQLSSTGFASFDRVFSSGELFDRDRSKIKVDTLGVITISRGCFERCGSNTKTPP